MGLELLHHYEDATRRENPFTHLLQTKMSSLGQRYGCRIPDILLTMQFRLDAKKYIISPPEPKLIFQPDGPSDAQLNFRHHTLRFEPKFSVCRFWLSMDALFGEGVVVKESTTVGGTIGAEKVVKGEFQMGGESGKESPGTRTSLHARLEGILSAKENLLEVWGELV
ncbi:hypothetical protein [Hymenobacter terrenus]|uniref:hypothetical protein n=1 Tax=Hymenobacter terrenus TaxID=1629124 RepID=UPI00061A0AB8|nr:hypothetical protein [Hymenobacter terrenus]